MHKKYVVFALFIAFVSLTFACQKNPIESSRKESIREREREEGGEREDSFYAERAYPKKTIPFGARVNAIEQADREELRMRRSQKFAREFAQLEAVSDEGWTALGPYPIKATPGDTAINYSGRVSAIALHPQYDGAGNQTVYVGGAQGGVWRSMNNGQNWTPIMDDQPSLAIGSIAIDPTNPNNIFVGTGEGVRSGDAYYGAGILKSNDGGATWRVIGGPNSNVAPFRPVFVNSGITEIAIDPVTPNVMFATSGVGGTASASGSAAGVETTKQRGVWRSTDSGESWTNVNPDGSDGALTAHDVLVDPLNHNTVYAAIRARGIYRSKSGGAAGSWERLTNGIATSAGGGGGFARCIIAAGPPIAPSTLATLYASFAGTATGELVFGIYKSTDGGDSWTKVTTPLTGGQSDYNMALAIDPVDANTIYYGGQFDYTLDSNCVVRSKDGGTTWTDMNSYNLHPDTHVLVVPKNNRNIIFTGNDGGIWRCDAASAGSVNWTTLNTELSLTQFQSVAMHPTNSNLIIGGTQDNGTHIFNGSRTWDIIDGGDGGFSLIDQSNPMVMYHTYYNQSGSSAQIGPAYSPDGGQRWAFRGCRNCTASVGRINPTDRPKFYAPMALNPAFTASAGNVVYFGTQRLYRTNDKGLLWYGLGTSTDSFGQDLTNGGSLTAIAVYPKIDTASPPTEIVWTGSSDSVVQVTSNAGAGTSATFTNTTKAPLPNRFITDIAADINNPDRAVVVYSGFNENTAATPGHIFITTNRGNTWADISGNLPDVPTTSVALDPNNNNRLWAGTDIGVFQTTDGGATWIRMNKGMPKVAVFMLRYHVPTGNLVAATHGRGVYRWRTNTTATSVSAASYVPSSDVARNSIVAAFGLNLATGAAPAPAGVLPLPTTIAGTSVTIRDSQNVERLASLFYAGPGQVNYQIPDVAAPGNATVIIKNSLGETSSGIINISAVSPGLFTGNSDGAGAVNGAAIRVRGASQLPRESTVALGANNLFVTKPLSFDPATESLFLELYGTGIRFVTSQTNVQCEIGGVTIPVEYAGLAPGYVGLDQVNIKIPNSLDNRGEVDLTLIVDGKRSRPVRVNIN